MKQTHAVLRSGRLQKGIYWTMKKPPSACSCNPRQLCRCTNRNDADSELSTALDRAQWMHLEPKALSSMWGISCTYPWWPLRCRIKLERFVQRPCSERNVSAGHVSVSDSCVQCRTDINLHVCSLPFGSNQQANVGSQAIYEKVFKIALGDITKANLLSLNLVPRSFEFWFPASGFALTREDNL